MDSMWTMVTKIFASKTLIVNWAALVAATLTVWTQSSLITTHPDILGYMVSALAGVNIVMRWLTTLPLSEK